MQPGEIYIGKKTHHPIVYLGKYQYEHSFIGCMITHSAKRNGNIRFSEIHFEKLNQQGVAYELQFENSCFVKKELIKKIEWGPFHKVGSLSQEGINFLIEHLHSDGEEPGYWQDYLDDIQFKSLTSLQLLDGRKDEAPKTNKIKEAQIQNPSSETAQG